MISACKETLSIWLGLTARHLHSRTLALDRFLHFPDNANDKEWRRKTCESIYTGSVNSLKLGYWRAFLEKLVGDPDQILFGQLKARLIVNGAGGVLENGGMSLDRNSGLPFIPGSATKGCARRWATWELSEAASSEKARILEHIALIFGWVDQDWSDNKNSTGQLLSDYKIACPAEAVWEQAREQVAEALAQRLRVKLDGKLPNWKQLPAFAGAVSFLPAFPWDKDPGVDLDVITCHHQKYYSDERDYAAAPDIEEPVPVVFPVVSAEKQPLFAFCVLTSRRDDEGLAERARTWLQKGLEEFGVGGKISAGYGWFDCSQEIQQLGCKQLESDRQAQQQRQERQEQAQREAEAREKAEQLKKVTEGMNDEQRADFEVAQLTDAQLQGRVDNFLQRDRREQEAVVRVMRLDPDAPNSRRKFWDLLKEKARRGGKPARIEQAVRELSRKMNLGKMP
ncbi:MAG: type III-B CRISPR module RAMP protein Cmr6 [Verrucomicrobia bacterium]|nr:type III-B CRISPR module RAMP protein Cmr6 [Verrucomicrobiota bacterium]